MANVINKLENVRRYLDQNHTVIARNISKANIPGSQAQSLKVNFQDLLGSNHKIGLAVTQAKHINITSASNNKISTIKTKTENTIDGNGINLTEQTANLAANTEEIKMNNSLYKEIWKIIKTAIGN